MRYSLSALGAGMIGLALLLGGIRSASASSTASVTNATVSANVVASISLTKVADMNFGDGAPGDGSEAIAATDGSCSGTGCYGTHTRGQFTVGGQGSHAYNITLPSSVTLTENGAGCAGTGTTTITVNGFTSSPSTSGTLSAGGSQTLYVGATRAALAANQDPCSYQGTYTITVSYP